MASHLVSMSMISFLRDGIWEMDSIMLQAVCRADLEDGVNMACWSQVVCVSFRWIGGVFHILSLHLLPYFSIKNRALTSFLASFLSDLLSPDSAIPVGSQIGRGVTRYWYMKYYLSQNKIKVLFFLVCCHIVSRWYKIISHVGSIISLRCVWKIKHLYNPLQQFLQKDGSRIIGE